jgi:hypothetical protein
MNPAYGGTSGQMMMTVNIDGKGSGDYMVGNVFTADYVQSRWSQAMDSSNGRVDNSIDMLEPGLIQS